MYYEILLSELNLKLCGKNIEVNLENQHFNPLLFDLIEQELYRMPMWSGVLISDEAKYCALKTRISNNIVECWFKILKTDLLHKKLNRSTSELAPILYKYLIFKYNQFYSQITKLNFAGQKEEFEKWKKPISKSSSKASFYHNDYDIFMKNYLSQNRSYQTNDEISNLFKKFFNLNDDGNKDNDQFKEIDLNENIIEMINIEDIIEIENIDETKDCQNPKKVKNDEKIDENYIDEEFLEVKNGDKKKQMKNSKNFIQLINIDNNQIEKFSDQDYFYFLKLTNNSNSCFANCIIQSFLALGDKFYNVSSIF